MKLTILQSPQYAETEITIRCNIMTPELTRLVEQIRALEFSFSGSKDGQWFRISLDTIFYFDSVDGRTFFYTDADCYEAKHTLSEIEARLANMSFLRISKNTIVNMHRMRSTRVIEAARMEVTMQNGEKLIVARHYLNGFKKAFGI